MIAVDRCPQTEPDAATRGGLPALTLPCLGHDVDVHLAGLRGRPTVVNLWASWCAPCRAEMPAFQRVHHRLGDRMQILGVAIRDSEREARRTIQGTGVSYPSVLDAKGDVRAALSAVGLPATFFLDGSGRIVFRHFGEMDEQMILDAAAQHFGLR